MHWVAFGTYDVRSHPRVAVLIEGLRASGDVVAEVNAPLGVGTAERVELLRRPVRAPLFFGRLARRWARLARLGRRATRHRRPDAVLVGYMGHFDVILARLLFPDVPIVLDHLVSAAGTADDRGLAARGGPKSALLRRLDRAALRRADVIVLDTDERRRSIPGDLADRVVVVPVGATRDWFEIGRPAAEAAAAADEPLRAVFVGLYTPLHGCRTIGEALRDLAEEPEVEVTMVGTGQDYRACRDLAEVNRRVRWLDWVPAEELPALVASHDVSLGIFGVTAKAQEVVPTKVYQAAAAGCAVVTSDTPPQRTALGDAAAYVRAGDPHELAELLRELARDRDRLRRLQRAAGARAADLYTPGAVVTPLRSAVSSVIATKEQTP
jgi:glycosyltransferase involved in cell wall biosynthesis